MSVRDPPLGMCGSIYKLVSGFDCGKEICPGFIFKQLTSMACDFLRQINSSALKRLGELGSAYSLEQFN